MCLDIATSVESGGEDEGADMRSEEMVASKRSDVEETGTHGTKVSDSGYSNSCSNSQSQRSGISESRHSSSSGSSGYCGHQSTLGSINEAQQQTASKRNDKEYEKKKAKASAATTQDTLTGEAPPPSPAQPTTNSHQVSEPALCNGARTPSRDSEALQMAALTHTLFCIKKLKSKDDLSENDCRTDSPTPRILEVKPEKKDKQIINCLNTEPIKEEELHIVVSLKDGIVLYTTPNLTNLLGFPKDMWVGRSLVNFIHPKHRVAFASHITSVIASPNTLDLMGTNGTNSKKNWFYCCLRQYRGLRSTGFTVTDKPVTYVPCQLTMAFREVHHDHQPQDSNNRVFLVITATAVRSAYQYGDEVKNSIKFMTRHLASTEVSHVDPDVMPYFGYLPQDMVGRSIFEFYHPEDLPALKDVYESVMKEQAQPLRSKPYRFRCQNGGFAIVETEWSTFVNPWSHKLEFIIGQHTVLRGPSNPDVTTPVEQEPLQISEQLMKESKLLQDQIKMLLDKTVGQSSHMTKQQVSKRCKDLATFMETLMDTTPPNLKVDVLSGDQTFSERDSVMLGEISPHHDYYNSKSSSETPPSYNQLNYNENLQRFFESKPKTTLSYESGDSKNDAAIASMSNGGEEGKISPMVNSSDNSLQRSCCLSNNTGTSSGQSIESNSNGNCGEAIEVPQLNDCNGYKPLTLTEKLLTKHNEDMEKQMMQKHRELRIKSDGKGKDRHKSGHDKVQAMDESGCHGLKRSSSHFWEGEPYKSMKTHPGTETGPMMQPPPVSLPPLQPPPAKPLNLWPPFSVGVTPLHNSQPSFTAPALASHIVSMYYVPEARQEPKPTSSYQHPAYITQQVSYVPGMVYHPLVFGTPPVAYSPMTMFPTPVFQPSGPMGGQQVQEDLANQALSEKGKTISSPGQLSQALISPRVEKKPEIDNDSNETSNVFDDSSIYSSFYSFLKTDKSDESMKSSPENESKAEEMVWEKIERQNGLSMKPSKKVAPWLENINLTQDLVLKYQLQERNLNDILKEDFKFLEKSSQPSMVNDQLSQMYLDLELEGLSRQLTLDEGITSSSESSGEETNMQKTKKKRFMEYDKMVILFEENAPLPPPNVSTSCM